MNLSSKGRWLPILAMTLIIGLFITLVLDFTALNDIHQEYISKQILETLDVTISKEVPVWTENKGEWDYLTLSLMARASGLILLFIMVIGLYRQKD